MTALQAAVRLGQDVGHVTVEDGPATAALEAARSAASNAFVAGQHAEPKWVGCQPVVANHLAISRNFDDVTRQASDQRVVPEPGPKRIARLKK